MSILHSNLVVYCQLIEKYPARVFAYLGCCSQHNMMTEIPGGGRKSWNLRDVWDKDDARIHDKMQPSAR